MTSREQFEAEYSKMIGTPISVLKGLRAGDVYTETEGDRLSIAWRSWQASREAVVVKLPALSDPADCYCDVYTTAGVISALRTAGVKVKED